MTIFECHVYSFRFFFCYRRSHSRAALTWRRPRMLVESLWQHRGECLVQCFALGVGSPHLESITTGLSTSGSAAASAHRLAREETLSSGEKSFRTFIREKYDASWQASNIMPRDNSAENTKYYFVVLLTLTKYCNSTRRLRFAIIDSLKIFI